MRLTRTSAGWVYWGDDMLEFSGDLVTWHRVAIEGLDPALPDDPAADPYLWLDRFGAAADALVAFGWIEWRDPSTNEDVELDLRISSQDGRSWTVISDPVMSTAQVWSVGSTGSSLVVTGIASDGTSGAWVSSDGRTWTPSTDPDVAWLATRVQAYAPGPDRVLAFAGDPSRAGDHWMARVDVWSSRDGLEWRRLGRLPGARAAMIELSTYGNGRWLVLGTGRGWHDYFWTSTNGIAWQRVERHHVIGVADVAGYTEGFVAVGTDGDGPGTTCGSGAPYTGRTWLSEDGLAWTEMARSRGVAMLALAVRGSRLYGIGDAMRDSRGRLWWGRLPGVLSLSGPTTLGPLPGGTHSCGD